MNIVNLIVQFKMKPLQDNLPRYIAMNVSTQIIYNYLRFFYNECKSDGVGIENENRKSEETKDTLRQKFKMK